MTLLWILFGIITAISALISWHNYSLRKQLKAAANEDLEIEQTINYIATSLFGQNTVDEILWDVARNCISKLGFVDCVIYLFDESGKKLIQKAAYGPKNPTKFEIYQPIEIPLGQGIVGTVAFTGVPEIVDDTTHDSRYIPDDEIRYSEITVPLLYEGRVIGVIDSEHPQKAFFKQRHLRILTTIASLCSNKIVKAKAQEEIRISEMKLIETDRMIAETKLMALRSQMNPHFIFNCLNSIQESILTNDNENAYRYLSKFSRLLRMVLETAEKPFITIEKEIDILKLYIELESFRFDNKFEYKINIDPKVDIDHFTIPTLIIQPYVENALWHGLFHKKDDRKLNVNIKKDNNFVLIVIEDNGIGRKRTLEMKNRFKVSYKSKGMSLNEDRIRLLNTGAKEKAEVKVIDLYLENEDPAGTVVEIRIPFNRQKIAV